LPNNGTEKASFQTFDTMESSQLVAGFPAMVKAVYAGTVIAESDDVKRVEGITYFPRDSVLPDALVESATTSQCFWKGKANYFHVEAGENLALDAAFAYNKPWPLARKLVTDRVGFWREVEIVGD